MRKLTAVLAAAAGLIFLITGCGQAESSPVPVGPPTDQITSMEAAVKSHLEDIEKSVPEGPAGSGLRVWGSATTFVDAFMTSPEQYSPQLSRVSLTVKATQAAPEYVSTFSAINSTGVRVDQLDPYEVYKAGLNDGAFDSGTSFVQGEIRVGYIYFKIVGPSKIYWGTGYSSKAVWNVK